MEEIVGIEDFKVDSAEDLDYIYSKYFQGNGFYSLAYYLELPQYLSQFYSAKGAYDKILDWNREVPTEEVDACLLAKICKDKTKFTKEDFADYFKVVAAMNSSYDFSPLHKLSDKRIDELIQRVEILSQEKREDEWNRSLQDNKDDLAELYGNYAYDDQDFDKNIRDLDNEIDFVNSLICGKPIMRSIEDLVRGFACDRDYFGDIRSILYGDKQHSEEKAKEENFETQLAFDFTNGKIVDEKSRDDR